MAMFSSRSLSPLLAFSSAATRAGLLISLAAIMAAPAVAAGPAAPSGNRAQAASGHSLLHRVIVVCSKYRKGNKMITEYCKDGYVCGEGNKCNPGPEMQRQIDEENKKREAAFKEAEEELNKTMRDLRASSRRYGDMASPGYADSRTVPSPQYGRPNPPRSVNQPSYHPIRSSAPAQTPGVVVVTRRTQFYRATLQVTTFVQTLMVREKQLPAGDPQKVYLRQQIGAIRKAMKDRNQPIEEIFVENEYADAAPADGAITDASEQGAVEATERGAEGKPGQQPPASASVPAETAPSKPRLSDADEVWCHFMADRGRRGDLTGGVPYPEKCKEAGILETSAPPPPPLIMDSDDRAEVAQIVRSFQDLLPPAPIE